MPSRRKGSRKAMKRSLRFTPKLVIKERADTIEDTLNEAMGRMSFRIPEDVANIIQGYEGGETLYFNVDPVFKKFVLSTTTPLKNGGKTYFMPPNYSDRRTKYPNIYFAEITIVLPYKINKIGNKKYKASGSSRKRVFLVGITDIPESKFEKMLEKYVMTKYHPYEELIRIRLRDTEPDSDSELNQRKVIKINSLDFSFKYPFEIEENNYNRILLEEII